MAKRSKSSRIKDPESETVSLTFTKDELKQLALTGKALRESAVLMATENYYKNVNGRATVYCDCDKM